MNQTEYEEMFKENENAQSEVAASKPGETQKALDQNKNNTNLSKQATFDRVMVTKRIYSALQDVAAASIQHPDFYKIAWQVEQIKRILEGED